ncbi:MAG TPA: hypothetical protein VHU15_00525 [Stellaceae bacterium]|jgi:hypothetical protein|nr:hypothetical protein [Stellaceae bacterium]
MTGGEFSAEPKLTSVLRRVPPLGHVRFRSARGQEGDVCLFELPEDASPIALEAPTGRMMTVAPGDTFLAVPGCRESIRWASGRIPTGGLVPRDPYWVIADSGIVGELTGEPPAKVGYFGRVRYLGAACGDGGETLNIRQFAVREDAGRDRGAPVYLIVGTCGNIGKTTAGIAVLRSLRMQRRVPVIALKATGTSSFEEIARYRDFGAVQAFDSIDFGLPTTFPSSRESVAGFFDEMLDFCLAQPADALVAECGGDLFGASVPEFLACLKPRRPDLKVVLTAPDALAAIGAKQVLTGIGLEITLITGPCTDTPTLRERTEALCGVPAINLARSADQGKQSVLSSLAAPA